MFFSLLDMCRYQRGAPGGKEEEGEGGAGGEEMRIREQERERAEQRERHGDISPERGRRPEIQSWREIE